MNSARARPELLSIARVPLISLLAAFNLSDKIERTLPDLDKPAPPVLAIRNITVLRGEFSERPALDRISLQIAAGEHVCILGPNGCGKSTLIKTITRECYPVPRQDSSIAILGRERWNIFELRSLLGIVSPDLLASCTTNATGRDIVLSGFFSSTRVFPQHHPDPRQQAQVDACLARLGISHLADRSVAQMSSGEAKRILIARALVHSPRTLLFDEPSNSLDIAAQFQLRTTMRQLAQDGFGILLVTHHVSEIVPEIARIVLLREGRVIADGPKKEILTADRLSALFGVPIRVGQRDGYFHLYSDGVPGSAF